MTGPKGAEQARWTTRWKLAVNFATIAFVDRRLAAERH